MLSTDAVCASAPGKLILFGEHAMAASLHQSFKARRKLFEWLPTEPTAPGSGDSSDAAHDKAVAAGLAFRGQIPDPSPEPLLEGRDGDATIVRAEKAVSVYVEEDGLISAVYVQPKSS